jgi:serine phosphatase RsbU (regulator of sigma subunit)
MKCMEVWGGNGRAEKRFAMPGLDVSLWSSPVGDCQAGGGDVHLLSSCASGRITRMLLADICGQGPAFVALASELRSLMMRNINAIKQKRLVRDMQERLHRFSDRGALATVLVSTYFAPSKSFAMCNVGHPPPLLYRARTGEWSVLKQLPADDSTPCDGPMGVIQECEYQQLATRLDHDDMVLSYSNVLSECVDSSGVVLGVSGLLNLVAKADPSRTTDILPALVHMIRDNNRQRLAEADVTLLLSRATDRHVSWKNNLLAPFRMLGSVTDQTRLD